MGHITKTAVFVLILQATLTNTAKNTARPVHEVINEQARVDDKRPLLYANPLAVTSNAKLHAQHQQAMFNAERVRQHRAQSQRWKQAPQIDSYMKAYQESQENHQLALERMQSNVNKRPPKTRQEKTLQEKETQIPELTKITRADAMVDKNRNHRSYGAVYYAPENKRMINTAPAARYNEGVTIKPNSNIGVNNLDDESRLYTEAVPAKTQYVYPKLYSQIHDYHSAEDIEALNYLLSKPADEQLTKLNALYNKETESLDKPMDLYFYTKDPIVKQMYSAPYNGYISDEKPITEAVDDIDDPNKFTKFQAYSVQDVLTPQTDTETTTKKSNYYKIKVEQTISGNKPADQDTTQYGVLQDKPSFQSLTYEKPVTHYPKPESGKYLHRETSGVQHLSQDGTGVSAYGADDVSKLNNRNKRELETNLFILGNENISSETISTKLDQSPFYISDKKISELNINITLPKSNLNDTGVSIISNTTVPDYEIETNDTLPKPEEFKRYTFNPEPDYEYEYDNYNDYDDYEYTPNNPYDYTPDKSAYHLRPNHKPSFVIPDSKVTDNRGSFSNRYNSHKRPTYYGLESYEPHSWIPDVEPVYMLTESQLKRLIGHHNLNMQHLNLYQLPKPKRPRRYPSKFKRFRKGPKQFRKLMKLLKVVRL